MLYIVTYINSADREVFHKKYPNIIVLPKRNKYSSESKNKIYSVIEFCRTKHSSDVILYIKPGNFLISQNKKEILRRFKSLGKNLIFSKRHLDNSYLEKYNQDRLFNSCLNMRFNHDFYIGTTHGIISIWSNFLKIPNSISESVYLSRMCQFTNKNKINIDSDNQIFYDYSIKDKITYKNNKFYLNNNTHSFPIFSFDGYQEAKLFLSNNNIIIHKLNQKKKRMSLLPEIIVLLIVFSIIYYFKFNLYSFLVGIIIISFFLEWRFRANFFHLNTTSKIFIFFIDIIHNILNLLVLCLALYYLFLIMTWRYNIKILMLFNTCALILYLSFFIFKRCVVQIIYDRITKFSSNFTPVTEKIIYFLFSNKPYFTEKKSMILNRDYDNKDSKLVSNMNVFMREQSVTLIILLIINIYVLIRLK